ncbi:twin-arginine translocation signal domain-containing protein [Salmonella enterica]|nr:twin-arginine translocation signal domain-containing protein [Salmonella enterica]EJA5310455.1 twin-arginine translocation signal domain-containing protein [Salmonella enterica]
MNRRRFIKGSMAMAAVCGSSGILNAALIIRPVTQSHGATILRWRAV